MRELIQKILRCVDERQPVAVCRLVETRGSTPQKPGAMMLVFPDGSQSGTLGGGCVEAEVKRKALEVLQEGDAQILQFQLDNDYGWDDGLICGGRMNVLVEPFVSENNSDVGGTPLATFYRKLSSLLQHGTSEKLTPTHGGATLVSVYDPKASALPPLACYLVDQQGELLAWVRDDSAAEHVDTLKGNLKPLLQRPRPYAIGGLSYLPILSRCRLVIVGGGHVGQAVAALASQLDFDVWVVDDRAEYVTRERFPTAERRIHGTMDDMLSHLEITTNTYCLIVTRGHNHDEEALFHLINRGARYVGMIGSKRKIKLIFDDLLEEGVSANLLEQVYAPVGLEIGSQTVDEIAVSIAAELVSHRNLGGKVPGRVNPTGANIMVPKKSHGTL